MPKPTLLHIVTDIGDTHLFRYMYLNRKYTNHGHWPLPYRAVDNEFARFYKPQIRR